MTDPVNHMAYDERAFNMLVHQYAPKLLSTAHYITRNHPIAEDIVQDAFLEFWRKRTELVYDNPGGWLYRVVYNQAYKHLKRETSRARLYASLARLESGSQSGAEERMIQQEGMAALDKACSLLPGMQQKVYRLRQYEGLSRHEIAGRLNISPNTVKVHLLRAVQFIREHMMTACLFAGFFIFNNILFAGSNTIGAFRELYNGQFLSGKKLPEKSIVYETVKDPPHSSTLFLFMPCPCANGFH